MTRRPSLIFAVLIASAVMAAPVPKALKKKTGLDGLWVSESVNGSEHRGWSLYVAGETMAMGSGWVPPDPKSAVPFTRDDGQTPAHLDVIWKGEDQPQLYVYHLDGDTLTLRHGYAQWIRPTCMIGGEGGGCLTVFKRVLADYKFPPPPKEEDDE